MKNTEDIREFQKKMWRYWNGDEQRSPPCLMCWAPSSCLHEIRPRSTYRDWYKMFPNINSIPLCYKCHANAHAGDPDMKVKLQKLAKTRAAQIDGRYLDWEDENPPRVSKSARPKMGMDGRSVLTIADVIRKRAEK